MGGDVHIRPTRRSTYRPMNTMNGDFLPLLKKPIASEMGQGMRGTNGAHREVLNKQLDQWYKERNFQLGKLKRAQEEVYGTLLQVHKHKKILQRESWKRQQEDCRRQAEEDMKGLGSLSASTTLPGKPPRALDPIVKDDTKQGVPVTNPAKDYPTKNNPANTQRSDTTAKVDNKVSGQSGIPDKPSAEDSKHDNKDNTKDTKHDNKDYTKDTKHDNKDYTKDTKHDNKDYTKDTTVSTDNGVTGDVSVNTETPASQGQVQGREVTAKVLEVRRGDPKTPLVRERSRTLIDIPTSGSDSNVKQLPDPLENFSSINELIKPDDDVNEKREVDKPEVKKKKKKKKPKAKLRKVSAGKRTLKSREPTLPRIAENSPAVGPARSLTPLPSQASVPTSPGSLRLPGPHRSPSDPRRAVSEPQVSLVLENKRRAKRKEKRRRDLLNKEGFTFYLRNKEGAIVPSDSPWRRKEFNPPSMREKAFQHKMLKAQTHAIDVQMQKLDTFMEKIDAEEKAKRRLRDAKRQLEEDERKAKEAKPKAEVGVTLQQLVAAFVRHDALPAGMDPDSFEAMQFCKYVRAYSPIADEEKEKVEKDKRSSWLKQGDYT